MTRAADAADPSEVVIALDFSSSILDDKANRGRFADALDKIADRVIETKEDLVTGDATVSLIRFASKAAVVKGCHDIHLKADPDAVDTIRAVSAIGRGCLSGRRFKGLEVRHRPGHELRRADAARCQALDRRRQAPGTHLLHGWEA